MRLACPLSATLAATVPSLSAASAGGFGLRFLAASKCLQLQTNPPQPRQPHRARNPAAAIVPIGEHSIPQRCHTAPGTDGGRGFPSRPCPRPRTPSSPWQSSLRLAGGRVARWWSIVPPVPARSVSQSAASLWEAQCGNSSRTRSDEQPANCLGRRSNSPDFRVDDRPHLLALPAALLVLLVAAAGAGVVTANLRLSDERLRGNIFGVGIRVGRR